LGPKASILDKSFEIPLDSDPFIDSSLSDHYLDILVNLTEERGFDGWLINIESPTGWGQQDGPKQFSASESKLLKNWIIKFRTKLREKIGDHVETIWYDSIVFPEGEIVYQNELNEVNKPWWDVCDGIFLNYW
jgi:mannosyl-glycoprotein endo-beta-N-acetylglucosaminidase